MTPVDSPSDDALARRLRQALAALPDAPPALQRAAVGLWPGSAPTVSVAAVAQAVWRRLSAALTFDSWAAAPALAHGMRSLRSPTRHLLFSAEGRDVDLRIAPAAGAFSLTGQIFGPDDSGTVQLHPSDSDDGAAAPHAASIDAMGEFRLDGVPPGRYRLTLRLGGDEVALPPVEVGEPGDG